MNVLISYLRESYSQCVHILIHHDSHCKCLPILFVNCIFDKDETFLNYQELLCIHIYTFLSFLYFLHIACMHAKSPHLNLCDPMDSSPPGSSATGYSRQEYWSGLPFPSPFFHIAFALMHMCWSSMLQHPHLLNDNTYWFSSWKILKMVTRTE